MNERIRELYKQAGTDSSGKWMSEFNAEKFAKLVAQDCARLCDRFQSRDVGMQPAECAGAIRQMFGVKE
jgi:hypothetical protein